MTEPSLQSETAHRVSVCGPADRADQVALHERCFGKKDSAAVLGWRYDQGPHGTSISLLARAPDGTAISGYACSPRRVISRGDETTLAAVGETGDVMTHPDWRGKGVFSGLDRAAMEETARAGWPVVFGLPNRRSERIFVEKLGWKEVGRMRPWTFVLALDEGARRERLRAGRLAAFAVPWTYWRGTMARGRLRNLAFDRVNTLAIPRFTGEVDALTRAVEERYDWMSRRDHVWLNWRFFAAPSGLFRAHGVYLPEGRMVGYAVLQLPRKGEATGYLIDLMGLDEIARAAAMDGALGHLRKAGASVARAWAIEGSAWESELARAGFRRGKPEDARIVIAYVHRPDHPLARAALQPSRWFFTDADRDDETVS